jgi:hypothetical protein
LDLIQGEALKVGGTMWIVTQNGVPLGPLLENTGIYDSIELISDGRFALWGAVKSHGGVRPNKKRSNSMTSEGGQNGQTTIFEDEEDSDKSDKKKKKKHKKMKHDDDEENDEEKPKEKKSKKSKKE